jgi:hypothetical protein
MMRARSVTGGLAAVLLVVTACGGDEPARAPVGDPAAEESAAVTEPVEPPPHDDAGARFDPALFGADSATIHNQWWPHIPGMQYVYEGQARDGEDTIERRIVATVSDVTKEVGGVRALLTWEQDFDDGVMIEEELGFDAQDSVGNIWHLGEYRETYEEAEFIGGRVWVVNDPGGAQAGILMPADPQPGDPSFSQGFAPPPWNWDDRGRAREFVEETCVEAGCYSDVLVVEEFEPSVPDAFQLKYYARDVGHVQVGWDGANEAEQEELELVEVVELSPDELAEVRERVLAMEDRGNAYSRLGPAQPIDAVP